MIALSLEEIARAVGARSPSPALGRVTVRRVVTDSREVAEGDLFVALDGERFRGSDHVSQALRAGAAAAISPRLPQRDGDASIVSRVLRVEDSREAFLQLGSLLRRRSRARFAAITGTNGKTTTKDMLAGLLAEHRSVVGARASFNNAVGVPLTLCRIEAETEAVVLEVGTSAVGEVARLASVASPHLGIITSIGPGHLEGLGSVTSVLAEKLSLAQHLRAGGVLLLNGDDPRLAAARPAVTSDVEVRRYGVGTGCEARAWEAEVGVDGVSFRMSPKGPRVAAPFLGRHNLSNLLAAATAARIMGLEEEEIAQAAQRLRCTPLRMERRRVGGLEVIFDCYNANPASMRAALDVFRVLPTNGRRFLALGDMLELGATETEHHEALGRALADGVADRVHLVGPAMKAAYRSALDAGFPRTRIALHEDRQALGLALKGEMRAGDLLLIKASRAMALENLFEDGMESEA